MENSETNRVILSEKNQEFTKDDKENDNILKFEKKAEPILKDIQTMIEQMMSPDSHARKNGEILWKLLCDNYDLGSFLTLGYFNTSLPDNIQEYCLILLKRYFTELNCDQTTLEQKLSQADGYFKIYLKCALQIPLSCSQIMTELVSIVVLINKNKSHCYIEYIFMELKNNDPEVVAHAFKIIQQIIKDIKVKDYNILSIISGYLGVLFEMLVSRQFTSSYKIEICLCIKLYIKKILENKTTYFDIIGDFKDKCPHNYSFIIDALILHSEPNGALFLIKLLKIIEILFKNFYMGLMRSEKLINRLWCVIKDLHIIHQYTNSCLINDISINNQKLFESIMKLTLIYFGYNCSPLEAKYLNYFVTTGIDLMKLEEKYILGVKPQNDQQLHDDEQFDINFQNSGLNATDIHPLRRTFLKFFNPKFQQLYVELLLSVYLKMLQELEECEKTIDLISCIEKWKSAEVNMWFISETAHIYFSLPRTDFNVYSLIFNFIKSIHEKKHNPFIYWQAILALISLCYIQPLYYTNEITSQIFTFCNNSTQLLYNKIFACNALQKITGIVRFKISTSQFYTSHLSEICHFLYAQFKNQDLDDEDEDEDEDDEIKNHFLKTICLLCTSCDEYLEKNLEEFFVFIFNGIKEFPQSGGLYEN